MRFHALVVDDSPSVLEDIKDRLESLGHSCDGAACLQEARENLRKNSYSYVLLDLEIPVRYGKPSRIPNGQNLLQEIRRTKGYESIPIIVMTAHGHDSPDLAIEVLRCNKAIDYVRKPFPLRGHTLEKAIRDALDSSGRSHPGAAKRSAVQEEKPPRPFEQGEMVFFRDRVELCEVKICGGSECKIRHILQELRWTNSVGRYVHYSGDKLADLIECDSGQNSVSSAIRDFRKNVCEAMLSQANIQMNRLNDIIRNDRRHGYCLSDKITVRDADDPVNDVQNRRDVVNDGQNDVVNGVDDVENNERQNWALEQMRIGRELRKADIVRQFGCSKTTAERDLHELRQRGLIEYVGAARNGHWRATS